MTASANPTLAYYAAHAAEFAASTANVEFASMRRRFTSLLAPGASILDLGCGSGRDTKAFLKAGFDVTATDGSPELCRYAAELTGIPVRNELFQDLADVDAYDGVWACSSIPRLPKDQLADVLRRISRALRPRGVVYASFRHGDFEGVRNGRHFTDLAEPALRGFLSGAVPELAIEQLWTTSDARPGKRAEPWLNAILRKAQPSARRLLKTWRRNQRLPRKTTTCVDSPATSRTSRATPSRRRGSSAC